MIDDKAQAIIDDIKAERELEQERYRLKWFHQNRTLEREPKTVADVEREHNEYRRQLLADHRYKMWEK